MNLQIKKAIKNLCKEFGISILYVFGSRSKEIARFLSEELDLFPNESDVDIGVKPHPWKKLTLQEKGLLSLRL